MSETEVTGATDGTYATVGADATDGADATVRANSPDGAHRQEEQLRIGGVALKNGLALVSERYWAAAIRETDGTIKVASGKKVRLTGSNRNTTAGDESGGTSDTAGRAGTVRHAGITGRAGNAGRAGFAGIPLVRGLGRFGESILVLGLVKAKLPNAGLPIEGGRVVAALAGSMAATSAVKAMAPKSAVVEELGTALAAFVPAVLSLKNTAISGYHGAEHKVIGGREAALRAASRTGAGAAPATARSAAAPKEHDRCGSNLVGPYLLATVATNLLARGRSGRKSPVASAAAGAASLGIALEALRWANHNADSVIARLLLSPGRAIQKRLTTTEPTAEQLEVGERALAELLRLEHAKRAGE